MRIIYLHQYFNTLSKASGTRSYEMARRLVSYGHEVHMITSERSAENAQSRGWFQTEENGIKVYWIPIPYSNNMSYIERIHAFIKFAYQASVKASSIDADLIFATSTPLTIALPAIYAKRKLRVPMVFEVRDLWPELPIAIGAIKNPLAIYLAKKLEKLAYKNSSHVIALSPGMKKGIIKAGYPADKITVIPNSCDLEIFDIGPEAGSKVRKRFDWLQYRPLVIYAGTIGIINGLDYLARVAYETWKLDRNIRFLVIGSGRDESKLIKEAKKLSVLDKNFYVMDRVPKYELAEWFSAADMVCSLFINLEEMWSNSANKFFDGLAASKPVAINYGGWQAELINTTGAGVVLDPDDAKVSAKLLVEKINNKEWLNEASIASGILAKERFNRNMLAARLNEVLRSVI